MEKFELDIMQEDFIAEWSDWNDGDVAFIKNDATNDRWLIYSSDGIQIGATDNREFAFVIAKQNELEPKSVH